jgi:hypothetical protein
MKDNEKVGGGAYGMYGVEDKCIKILVGKPEGRRLL